MLMNRKHILIALLAVSATAGAQQDSSVNAVLEEVTITAARKEQKLLAVPRSATIITAADIRRLPYQNLADLLQRAEGIYIPGTHQAPGALQSVFLRGADSKQVLVMIDGIKLSDNSSPDNALDFSEISLADVERIEIVRGAQGTLYGNSAVGGVINIITKKAGKKSWQGNASLQAGNYGENRYNLQTQAGVTYTAKSGIYAGGEILHNKVNGVNAVVAPRDGSFFVGEEDDFLKMDYSVKTGIKKQDWDGHFTYRNAYQKSDIDDGPFRDDENYIISTRRSLYTWGLSRKFNDKFSARLFGGYTRLRRHNFDDSSLVARYPAAYDGAILEGRYTGKNLTNELQLNYNTANWKLVAGLGYLTDRMSVNSRYYNYAFGFGAETNYDTLGLGTETAFGYSHAEYSVPLPHSVFNISGGLRYSNHSRFGNFLTYEIAPSLLIDNRINIFASWATGFNAPGLYQLFAPEKDFTSGITRGYAGLEPEKSRSLELGVKAMFGKTASARISAYHNVVENSIDYVYLWNGAKPVNTLDFSDFRGDTYLNVGKQFNKGVEAGVDFFPGKKWELRANISYNDGELQYSPALVNTAKTGSNHVQLYSNGAFLNKEVNDQTVRRPSLLSNSSVVFKPTDKWRFSIDARYVGKRKDIVYDAALGPFGALAKNDVGDYTLFNAAAGYRINRHFSASFAVYNLFLKNYTELNGLNTRPRYGELRLQATL